MTTDKPHPWRAKGDVDLVRYGNLKDQMRQGIRISEEDFKFVLSIDRKRRASSWLSRNQK